MEDQNCQSCKPPVTRAERPSSTSSRSCPLPHAAPPRPRPCPDEVDPPFLLSRRRPPPPGSRPPVSTSRQHQWTLAANATTMLVFVVSSSTLLATVEAKDIGEDCFTSMDPFCGSDFEPKSGKAMWMTICGWVLGYGIMVSIAFWLWPFQGKGKKRGPPLFGGFALARSEEEAK